MLSTARWPAPLPPSARASRRWTPPPARWDRRCPAAGARCCRRLTTRVRAVMPGVCERVGVAAPGACVGRDFVPAFERAAARGVRGSGEQAARRRRPARRWRFSGRPSLTIAPRSAKATGDCAASRGVRQRDPRSLPRDSAASPTRGLPFAVCVDGVLELLVTLACQYPGRRPSTTPSTTTAASRARHEQDQAHVFHGALALLGGEAAAHGGCARSRSTVTTAAACEVMGPPGWMAWPPRFGPRPCRVGRGLRQNPCESAQGAGL